MRRSPALVLLALAACSAAPAPQPEVAVVAVTAPAPPVPALAEATPPEPTARPAARPPADDDAPVEWTDHGAAPRGTLRMGRASATPELSDMAAVIVALRPRLLRCIDRAARHDPRLKAPLVLEVKLGAGGEVVSARAQPRTGVPEELSTCLEAQLLSAHFAPPQGGAATLTIPLTVSAQ